MRVFAGPRSSLPDALSGGESSVIRQKEAHTTASLHLLLEGSTVAGRFT